MHVGQVSSPDRLIVNLHYINTHSWFYLCWWVIHELNTKTYLRFVSLIYFISCLYLHVYRLTFDSLLQEWKMSWTNRKRHIRHQVEGRRDIWNSIFTCSLSVLSSSVRKSRSSSMFTSAGMSSSCKDIYIIFLCILNYFLNVCIIWYHVKII